MATKVLDSWALIAFFENEPAADEVEKLLQEASEEKHRLLLCVVNWGEVYYNTMREVSPAAAEQTAQDIAALPIDIIGVGDDLALAKQAAAFKARHKLSFADCFAAALAKHENAELVTGDPGFKALAKEIKVRWL